MKRIPMAALALALVTAGSSPGADEKEVQTPYFPLKVGNIWNYRVGDNKFFQTVAKFEKVGGVNCARIEQFKDKKIAGVEHIGVTAPGVARYSFDGTETKPPVFILQLEPTEGKSWKVDTKWKDETLKGTFKIGPETEIKVPAGTFKAIPVIGKDLEIKGQKVNLTYYFVKNLGMAKQVFEMGKTTIVVELESFVEGKKK
jgi:hypothetical protein